MCSVFTSVPVTKSTSVQKNQMGNVIFTPTRSANHNNNELSIIQVNFSLA